MVMISGAITVLLAAIGLILVQWLLRWSATFATERDWTAAGYMALNAGLTLAWTTTLLLLFAQGLRTALAPIS